MASLGGETIAKPGALNRTLLVERAGTYAQQWRAVVTALLATDILMLYLALLFAYLLRFRLNLPLLDPEVTDNPAHYQTLELVLIPICIGLMVIFGLYQVENLLGGTREYARIFPALTVGMLSLITVSFLLHNLVFSRGWLVLTWLSANLFAVVGRFAVRRGVYYLRRKGFLLKTAIILGANAEGCSLAEQLQYSRYSGLNLVGFLDDQVIPGTRVYNQFECLGPLDQLSAVVEDRQVQEIILSSSALPREKVVEIFKQFGMLSGATLRLSSGMYETITTGLEVREFASVPLVRVKKVRLDGLDQVQKTALDYTLAVFALLVSWPCFLLIALAIRLDSPGSIIYRRRVLGVNGKEFDAFKFRTMLVNGDRLLESRPDLQAELAENYKLKDDPRVTRVGRFLRKFSLDELPQIINILRNEMSWVGPRMITPAEIHKYEQWGMNLLTVKPGLTGKWQVSGRSDLSYEARVRLDMFYIRNWTIWQDIYLLIQTLPAVLLRKGAY